MIGSTRVYSPIAVLKIRASQFRIAVHDGRNFRTTCYTNDPREAKSHYRSWKNVGREARIFDHAQIGAER